MEVRPLRRKQRRATASARGLSDDEVRIALTGVGPGAAEVAAEKLLGRYPVRLAISAGFAGALSQGLEAGQLFASHTVYAPGNPPLRTDAALLDRALAVADGDLMIGASVSVPSAVTNQSSREALHAAYEAQTVDMESYWIARAALHRGIPCLVLRAVSDTVDQKLFSLSLLSVLWRQSRLAVARLADFINRFLWETGREGDVRS